MMFSEKTFKFTSDWHIADGQWHSLRIRLLSSREVEVEIDGKSAGLVDNKLEAGASEPEENLRVLLGGFKGCFDNFRLNNNLVPMFNQSAYELPQGFVPAFRLVASSTPRFEHVTYGQCTGDDVCVTRSNGKEPKLAPLRGPCVNGANCTDEFNRYTCTCVKGFTGKHCETNIDDCAENSCATTGKCIDGVDGFTCLCEPGYEGDRCEHDIDECAGKQPCLNGAKCRNFDGGHQCVCSHGFVGVNCEYSIHTHCSSSNSSSSNGAVNTQHPCQNGGRCSFNNSNKRFACECIAPYVGEVCDKTKDLCDDVNCQNGAPCLFDKESYRCECGKGYAGTRCEVITECSPTTCFQGGKCTNQNNSTGHVFQCICPPEYAGRRCETVNRCHVTSSSTEEYCTNGGECRVTYPMNDSLPTFQCSCSPKFVGSRCSFTSPCTNSTCQHSGTCVVTWKSERDNETTTVQPLESLLPPDFKCLCSEGFSGALCEIDSKAKMSSMLTIGLAAAGCSLLLFILMVYCLVKTCLERRKQSGEYSPNATEHEANGAMQLAEKPGGISPRMITELQPLPPCERLI